MSNYDEAVQKRAAHKAAKTTSDTSILDWAKQGVDIVSGYVGTAKTAVKRQVEKVAPSDPEARIQKEIVDKVNRDELIDQFESAGRAFGSKVATAAGTTGSAAWAFLKSATGQISAEAKSRLESLDTAKEVPTPHARVKDADFKDVE